MQQSYRVSFELIRQTHFANIIYLRIERLKADTCMHARKQEININIVSVLYTVDVSNKLPTNSSATYGA